MPGAVYATSMSMVSPGATTSECAPLTVHLHVCSIPASLHGISESFRIENLCSTFWLGRRAPKSCSSSIDFFESQDRLTAVMSMVFGLESQPAQRNGPMAIRTRMGCATLLIG